MAWQTDASAAPVHTRAGSESQRIFMTRVYQWMFLALAITGSTAFYTVTNRALLSFVLQNYLLLSLGTIGLVFALSFLAHRVSGPIAAVMFLGYSVLMGMSLSGVFLVYQLGSIAQAFFVTAGVFGAMSVYGTVTKKDLTSWSTFLFMGLIGVVIAAVVNIFMQSGPLSFVISCASVVVFTGLTAYDTQKLRQMHVAAGGSAAMSLAIVGALTLYLDFVNLFLSLLRLFGSRR